MTIRINRRRSRLIRYLSLATALLALGAACIDWRDPEPVPHGSTQRQALSWWDPVDKGAPPPPAHAAQSRLTTGLDKVRFEVTEPFRTTSTDALQVDAQTRVSVEEWLLLELDSAVDARRLLDRLPDPARSQAKQLIENYKSCQTDVRQQIDSSQAPASVEELSTQFELLRRLRRFHFGEPVAQQLFDEEERTTQELIKLIVAQDQTEGLSLQERAERAQQAWLQQQQRRLE